MKHASLLLALCVLFGLSSFAQSTPTPEKEKNVKRITITTKKVDDNGKVITETYIAEGNEPAKILEGMAIDPGSIQRMDVEGPAGENEERLFLIRTAGDDVHIEGTLNENAEQIIREVESKDGQEIEKVIIINSGGPKNGEYRKMMTTRGYAYGGHESKINCAALGVYANTGEDVKGARINSLIDNGGAQAAGLKPGDIVTKIEEFDVTDFPTLHLALSHFQPGDVVTVRYDREGKGQKAKVELKDWKELPGHEWRSRSDCAQPTQVEEEIEESLKDDPIGLSGIEALELQEVKMFPNPTEGMFSLSFRLEPGPLTVAITDINGKVIYSENNENASGSYSRDLDLKGVPQGNYVITVTQGDRVYTDQISKQ